ncbi:hypothetical protein E2C01_068393 [Portunus trituberculatus]|uniref:Uncharacterized protein n=1 Tax=Portunus trituberculatus TaxID=210409 RepID=A0A5B7HZB5_PORTR|nr:hypothetical protein [Portunus trituberculatus]
MNIKGCRHIAITAPRPGYLPSSVHPASQPPSSRDKTGPRTPPLRLPASETLWPVIDTREPNYFSLFLRYGFLPAWGESTINNRKPSHRPALHSHNTQPPL